MIMKKYYEEPELEVLAILMEDIMKVSGDEVIEGGKDFPDEWD